MATNWRCDIYLGQDLIDTLAVNTAELTDPGDAAAVGLNQAILTHPDLDVRQMRCIATSADDLTVFSECSGYTWTDL